MNLLAKPTFGRGQAQGITAQITPFNPHDLTGDFLGCTGLAAGIARKVQPRPRPKFDSQRARTTEGDVERRLKALLPLIGQIRVAHAPDRGDHNDACGMQHGPQLGWLAHHR